MDALAMKGTCTLTRSQQKFKIFKNLLIPSSCSENKWMKMSPRTSKLSISKQCSLHKSISKQNIVAMYYTLPLVLYISTFMY